MTSIQFTQEKRPGSQIGLTINLEAAQIQRAYEKTVRDFVKNAQLRGFRKGKAPRNLVIQSVGRDRLKAVALEDLMNDSVKTVLTEADIDPISQFKLDSDIATLLSQFDPNADLSFSGYVEVQPQVTLASYKDLKVEALRVDPDPTKVDTTLDEYRSKRATLLPVEDRPVEMGDMVTVDFVGRTLDGTEIEGATATDFQLEMEESKFIPGFIAGMVGMTIDETREIDAQFPDDYTNEDVAGQAAKFTVTLADIKTRELPPLDDQFAQDISDFATLDELRAFLEERYAKEALEASVDNLQEAIVEAILIDAEIDLPETLIQQEVTFLIRQSVNYLGQQGVDVNKFLTSEMVTEMRDRSRPEAIERLRRTLALAHVVKEEQISVGQTELEMQVQALLQQYQGQEKLDPKQVTAYVQEEILTNKVMTWLESQTTVQWVDDDENPVDPPAGLSKDPAMPATAPSLGDEDEPVAESTPTSDESDADESEVDESNADETISSDEDEITD